MTVTAREALAELVAASEDGRLDARCADLGVRLLGVFGSAVRPGTDASDLDISVAFAGHPRHLDLIDALVEITGFDQIDLLDLDSAGPVARARGLTGRGLFETDPGLWAITQMTALAEERDTAHLRELDRRALAG